MAYDIHIARTAIAASQSMPCYSLDIVKHKSIFLIDKSLHLQFPLFYRMADFFNDASYSYESLLELHIELLMLAKISVPQVRHKFVLVFVEIVKKAKSDSCCIFCFCD